MIAKSPETPGERGGGTRYGSKAELATLIEVGQDISASLDLDEVLKRAVRQAARLMRAKMCS